MATPAKSRWADDEADAVFEAQKKKEKEEKRRAKAKKQRKLEDSGQAREAPTIQANGTPRDVSSAAEPPPEQEQYPAKRRKVDRDTSEQEAADAAPSRLLRLPAPEWGPCRHVDNFEKLNHIEEGSYGWVSRARETATREVVALKKLKMMGEKTELPVTGLREIQTLMVARHENIVKLREVVVGDNPNDVFLVMDFVEHDLRSLREDMPEPFLLSEVKTLLLQLFAGVHYLHNNWILHRDLKTSNLLLNNRGQLKIADFGMARFTGDPPPKLTQVVTTLWYRAPELILGAESYAFEVDIWSIGCIFSELLASNPLCTGKNEVDQLTKIFKICGIPTVKTWPGFRRLPHARSLRLPPTSQNSGTLRHEIATLTAAGGDLLMSLLSLNPRRRPSAAEVLKHPFFDEKPRPKSAAMFPTYPSKAGQEKRRRAVTPSAHRAGAAASLRGDLDLSGIFAGRDNEEFGAGFQLKLV